MLKFIAMAALAALSCSTTMPRPPGPGGFNRIAGDYNSLINSDWNGINGNGNFLGGSDGNGISGNYNKLI
jgi:hypothetical protein